MRLSPLTVLLCGAALGTVGLIALNLIHRNLGLTKYRPSVSPVDPAATKEIAGLRDLALRDRTKAEAGYRSFVASHRNDADPYVQDQVGSARIQAAYIVADRKDYEGARALFDEAAKEYRGTGVSGEFGGVKDGASYQAAVCLMAEGKRDEARRAFSSFLKEQPLSPLVKAAYRRLTKLNGGKSNPEEEAVLNKDLAEQQKRAALESVACGPKTLQIVLKLLGKPSPSLEELAKLCGTGKDGTSMEGLHRALKALGVASYAVFLNRQDLMRVQTPAIMLLNEHYSVLTKISEKSITYVDPISAQRAEVTAPLPPASDPSFGVTLLVFQPPSLGAQN